MTAFKTVIENSKRKRSPIKPVLRGWGGGVILNNDFNFCNYTLYSSELFQKATGTCDSIIKRRVL